MNDSHIFAIFRYGGLLIHEVNIIRYYFPCLSYPVRWKILNKLHGRWLSYHITGGIANINNRNTFPHIGPYYECLLFLTFLNLIFNELLILTDTIVNRIILFRLHDIIGNGSANYCLRLLLLFIRSFECTTSNISSESIFKWEL